jgi:hypothetical protein
MYRKMISNPTMEDLETFILEGQRATWPDLARIEAHTRVERTIAECLLRLKRRLPSAETPL